MIWGVFYEFKVWSVFCLTHWDRVTHICVSKLTIIGSDNGLSPGRRRAIIWTNAQILLIGPLGTNSSEILIEIHTFSFKKIYLKMSSTKWRLFRLGLNVLSQCITVFNTLCIGQLVLWQLTVPGIEDLWMILQTNKPISQFQLCIRQISYNAPFYNRNVHISVTKWYIVGYLFNALWDLWDGSIVSDKSWRMFSSLYSISNIYE